jgi:hypothetical protein
MGARNAAMGKRAFAAVPARAPIIPPIKRDGPRTPPDPPEPREKEVAMIFRNPIPRRRTQGRVPWRA